MGVGASCVDQLQVSVVQQEVAFEVAARGGRGKPAVRCDLLLGQEVNRHGMSMDQLRTPSPPLSASGNLPYLLAPHTSGSAAFRPIRAGRTEPDDEDND